MSEENYKADVEGGLVLEWVNGKPVNPPAVSKLIEEAGKRPINYTRDAPRLTDKQLANGRHRTPEELAFFGIYPKETQKPQEMQETQKKQHSR